MQRATGGVENEDAAPSGKNPAAVALLFRCHPDEKSAYVNAAGGKKLAAWIRETLNARALAAPDPGIYSRLDMLVGACIVYTH